MVAGMVTQGRERLLHVEAFSLCDDPLGLLDDDPAVERMLELLVDDLGFEGGAVLEDGDGRDVGQGLGGVDVGFVHFAGLPVGIAKAPTAGFVFSFNFLARRTLLFVSEAGGSL